jgi:hypothetical protein
MLMLLDRFAVRQKPEARLRAAPVAGWERLPCDTYHLVFFAIRLA